MKLLQYAATVTSPIGRTCRLKFSKASGNARHRPKISIDRSLAKSRAKFKPNSGFKKRVDRIPSKSSAEVNDCPWFNGTSTKVKFGRPKLSRVLDQSFKHPLEFKKPQLKFTFGRPKYQSKFESLDPELPD